MSSQKSTIKVEFDVEIITTPNDTFALDADEAVRHLTAHINRVAADAGGGVNQLEQPARVVVRIDGEQLGVHENAAYQTPGRPSGDEEPKTDEKPAEPETPETPTAPEAPQAEESTEGADNGGTDEEKAAEAASVGEGKENATAEGAETPAPAADAGNDQSDKQE